MGCLQYCKKIFAFLVRKIGVTFVNITSLPGWEYTQNEAEINLHKYLKRKKSEISNIIIVGGYTGREIPKLLHSYPRCQITVFECSPRDSETLRKKFLVNHRVSVIEKAVSDTLGFITFNETTKAGSGSILNPGKNAKKWFELEKTDEFTVSTTTLDDELNAQSVDCLWIDVQGAEGIVLSGAERTLASTDSIFIEVSVVPEFYEGSITQEKLIARLAKYDFHPVAIGLDSGNLTGNALFIKVKH